MRTWFVEVRTTYHIFVSAAMRQINLIGMHNKLIPGPAKYALTKFTVNSNDAVSSLKLLTKKLKIRIWLTKYGRLLYY